MRKVILLLIIYAFSNCKNNTYSINDFGTVQHKDLVEYVNDGIFRTCGVLENKIKQEISPVDVEKLLKSEHPLLRALASYIYVSNDNFRLNEKFYELLSDTAIVNEMACGCGQYQQNSAVGEIAARVFSMKKYFKDTKSEEIHLTRLIQNYPHLNVTFDQLCKIDYLGMPELYSGIQKMAQMNKSPEIKAKAIEALARYQKHEDTTIIFKFYGQNPNIISKSLLEFLTKNPNGSFINLLQLFAHHYLYTSFNRDFLIEGTRNAYLKCISTLDNNNLQNIFSAIWDIQNEAPMDSYKLNNQLNMLEIIKDNNNPFYQNFIRHKNMNTIQIALNEVKIAEAYEEYIRSFKNTERIKLLYAKQYFDEPPPPPPPPPMEKKVLAKNTKLKALYKEFLALAN